MSHELTTVPTASLEDIDVERFGEWLREHVPRLATADVSVEDALLRLRLAAPMGSRMVPTLAAIYAFGREPQWLQPQLGIHAALYAGKTLADQVLDRAHIDGTMPDLLNAGLAFVERHTRTVIDHVRPDVLEWEFPKIAVREALSNALVHRDLKATGSVQIRIFDGRLEIWSPGAPAGLPEPIENYLSGQGISMPRNPMVAVIARQMGMVEQLGRGLSIIKRAASARGFSVKGTRDGVLVTIESTLAGGFDLSPGTVN